MPDTDRFWGWLPLVGNHCQEDAGHAPGRDQTVRDRIPVKQWCAGGYTIVEELFRMMLGVNAHFPLPTRVPTTPGGVP